MWSPVINVRPLRHGLSRSILKCTRMKIMAASAIVRPRFHVHLRRRFMTRKIKRLSFVFLAFDPVVTFSNHFLLRHSNASMMLLASMHFLNTSSIPTAVVHFSHYLQDSITRILFKPCWMNYWSRIGALVWTTSAISMHVVRIAALIRSLDMIHCSAFLPLFSVCSVVWQKSSKFPSQSSSVSLGGRNQPPPADQEVKLVRKDQKRKTLTFPSLSFSHKGRRGVLRRYQRMLPLSNVIKQVLRMNIFRSLDSHTEYDVRNEFRSTRLYIIALIISVGILVEYSFFTVNVKTITLDTPSLEKITELENRTLVCPCSTSVIPYGTFLSVAPIFHPICSSDFVSDPWLTELDRSNDQEILQLCVPFRLLYLFCALVQKIVHAQLRQLDDTRIVNPRLIPQAQLESEADAKVKQVVSSARTAFFNALQLFQDTTSTNRLLSISDVFQPFATFWYALTGVRLGFVTYWDMNPTASCPLLIQTSDTEYLPGFHTLGNGLEKLLSSSFVSFDNETILQQLSSLVYANRSSFLRPLKLPISYSTNDTIESILNTLMLDNYTQEISYPLYFSTCQPKLCLYTATQRYTLLETISLTIGVIGGMTSVLGFVIPFLIRSIIRRKKNRNRPVSPLQDKVRLTILYLGRQARSLNLFKHSSKTHLEICSTRIYLVILVTVNVIIIFYTSLTFTTQSITVQLPTYDQFGQLDAKYNQTLVCPCSTLAVAHQTFVSIFPRLHQICASDFITDAWIAFIDYGLQFSHEITDLRRSSSHLCDALRILCQLSQRSVDERVSSFGQTLFVSSRALNEARLQEQINAILQQSIQASERQFSFAVKLNRDTTFANQVSHPIWKCREKNRSIDWKQNRSPSSFPPNSFSIWTVFQYGKVSCL